MNHLYLLPILMIFNLLLANQSLAFDCANANTTVEMMDCADKDYQSADKRLNQAYGAFKKTMDINGIKLLLNSQRAWLKFRDANCSLAADQARGGTMVGLLQIGCLTTMTDERTKELNELAKGLE